MIALRSNQLLMWSVGLFVGYWAFGLLMPGVWFSAFISACLLVGGAILAATALPDAVAIIRRGEIGPGELAVIAIAVLATGSIYSGTFSIAWALSGNPIEWIGPVSAFGRAMMAGGFVLLFLSPDATRKGIRPPRWYVVLIGALLIALIAFLLGTQWGGGHPISSSLDLSRLPSWVPRLVRFA
jgi:hypothetical protein